jgi:hypothetical protein
MRFSLPLATSFALSCVACTERSVITVAAQPDNHAWYLRAEFRALHKRVRGIPVKKLRNDWCAATELTKEMVPSEFLVVDGQDTMAATGLSFAVDGFFDNTGIEQTALVGVYESCSGQKGGFLLIVDKSSVFTGKIRFVLAYPTVHPFAALAIRPGEGLLVMNCMDCDDGGILQWDSAKNTFVWRQEGDAAGE